MALSSPRRLRWLLPVTVPLACRTPVADDTGSAPVEVLLSDLALSTVQMSYDIGQAPLLAGGEGVVTWTELTVDTHGRAVDSPAAVAGLVLARLTDDDLAGAVAALARGELAQQAISLQVGCATSTGSCQIAELAFDSGHPIDMAAAFAEGTGPWLAWLDPVDGNEPVALVELVPTAEATAVAAFQDGGSRLTATLTADETPLALPLDGQAWLDWASLTVSSQGAPLFPQRLDQLALSRVAADTPDEDRLLRLAEVALDRWEGEVSGATQVWLPDLRSPDGSASLGELGGEGDWLLTLSCSTCTAPQPTVVVAVQPR